MQGVSNGKVRKSASFLSNQARGYVGPKGKEEG